MNCTRYSINSNTGTNSTATKTICNTQAQQHKNTVTAALLQLFHSIIGMWFPVNSRDIIRRRFIRVLGRCCTFSETSVRYSSSYAIPFLGQMLSGIEEIKVLGAYIFVFGLYCPLVIRVIQNTRDNDRYWPYTCSPLYQCRSKKTV